MQHLGYEMFTLKKNALFILLMSPTVVLLFSYLLYSFITIYMPKMAYFLYFFWFFLYFFVFFLHFLYMYVCNLVFY